MPRWRQVASEAAWDAAYGGFVDSFAQYHRGEVHAALRIGRFGKGGYMLADVKQLVACAAVGRFIETMWQAAQREVDAARRKAAEMLAADAIGHLVQGEP